jgi:hypothetical protein
MMQQGINAIDAHTIKRNAAQARRVTTNVTTITELIVNPHDIDIDQNSKEIDSLFDSLIISEEEEYSPPITNQQREQYEYAEEEQDEVVEEKVFIQNQSNNVNSYQKSRDTRNANTQPLQKQRGNTKKPMTGSGRGQLNRNKAYTTGEKY